MAQALNSNRRTLQRWRTGTAYPQQPARRWLAELLRLQQRVRETFGGRDTVRRWFHSESRYLGGRAPVEAIRVGPLDRVEAVLDGLDSGVFLQVTPDPPVDSHVVFPREPRVTRA